MAEPLCVSKQNGPGPAHPYGQHPLAKNRQQNLFPVASALVYPASLEMMHRDCDNVLLRAVYQEEPFWNGRKNGTYLASASSLSPPAHLLYQMSMLPLADLDTEAMAHNAKPLKIHHELNSLYSFPG